MVEPRRDGADAVHGRRLRGLRAGSLGRRGVGIELKPSYYRQAVKNMRALADEHDPQSWLDHVEADVAAEAPDDSAVWA